MNTYFTSDWHLGDSRPFMKRPFKSSLENDYTIVNNFINSGFSDGDTLYFLGDFVYELNAVNEALIKHIKDTFPNSEFICILGNYDEDKRETLDSLNFFTHTFAELLVVVGDRTLFLNHYPLEVRRYLDSKEATGHWGITGHIHGLWKVQERILNVGVDCHNYLPLSEEDVLFYLNAIEKHYDGNVFLSKPKEQ